MSFQKATRKKAKVKVALFGPSGSGKTYSALLLAKGIGGRIAVLDTERGSASLYAGNDSMPEYDVMEMTSFDPLSFVQAIDEAVKLGYDILIIDSMSHEWTSSKEEVDRLKQTMKNEFAPWGKVTPKHNAFVDRILQSPIHVIATMRAKTAYSMEKDERTGKTKPVKVGLEPDQRQNIEYEFTTIFTIDETHTASVNKDRTQLFKDFHQPITVELGELLRKWLDSGFEAPKEIPPDAKEKTPVPPKPIEKKKPEGPKIISEAQANQLFTLSKNYGWQKPDLQKYIGTLGYESLYDIQERHYDDILQKVKKGPHPEIPL